uniref:6-phosphofructokinase 2 n=1 Tax=Arundo donax TaxID=35708 RepID=A0A0A9DVH3_ARUDO
MSSVDGLLGLLHGSVKTKRLVNHRNVIIYGLWDPDNRTFQAPSANFLINYRSAFLSTIASNNVNLVNTTVLKTINNFGSVMPSS